MVHRLPLLLLSLCACAAPEPRAQEPSAGWFNQFNGGQIERFPLDEMLATPRFARSDNILPVTLAIGAHSSYHLVQVRDAEPLHVHATHDLAVRLVRGQGRLRLGDHDFPIALGDATFIPRGVPHAFTNTGAEPAALLATFSPAFDGTDRVLLNPAAH
jgi:mannose-6-phosphate isomerase-like protein (cupin superfamily)